MTLKAGRGQLSKYMPFAFTEQGAAMLSGILNSDKAINMNIYKTNSNEQEQCAEPYLNEQAFSFCIIQLK